MELICALETYLRPRVQERLEFKGEVDSKDRLLLRLSRN